MAHHGTFAENDWQASSVPGMNVDPICAEFPPDLSLYSLITSQNRRAQQLLLCGRSFLSVSSSNTVTPAVGTPHVCRNTFSRFPLLKWPPTDEYCYSMEIITNHQDVLPCFLSRMELNLMEQTCSLIQSAPMIRSRLEQYPSSTQSFLHPLPDDQSCPGGIEPPHNAPPLMVQLTNKLP
jgi:hypothetical protein